MTSLDAVSSLSNKIVVRFASASKQNLSYLELLCIKHAKKLCSFDLRLNFCDNEEALKALARYMKLYKIGGQVEIRLEQLNQLTNKFLDLLSAKPIRRLILTTVSIKAPLSQVTQEAVETLTVNYYNHLRDHQRPNLFNPFRQGRFNEPLDE